jgi:hypothetical protein
MADYCKSTARICGIVKNLVHYDRKTADKSGQNNYADLLSYKLKEM